MSTENPFVFNLAGDRYEVLFECTWPPWGHLEYMTSIGWHFHTEENRLTAAELGHIALKLFELNGK